MNPLFSISTLKSIYSRKGGNGLSTKLFLEFPSEIQEKISSNLLSLNQQEEVIIAFFLDNFYWVALTAQKFIVFKDNTLISIPHTDIKKTEIDMMLSYKSGFKTPAYFLLLTSNGDKHSIRLEEGIGFLGLYNVVSSIATKNNS
jgi:hypothetical protein